MTNIPIQQWCAVLEDREFSLFTQSKDRVIATAIATALYGKVNDLRYEGKILVDIEPNAICLHSELG